VSKAQDIAGNRFGLGISAKSRAAGDPRQSLLLQMRSFEAKPQLLNTLATRSEIANELSDFIDEARSIRMAGGEEGMKGEEKQERQMARRAVSRSGRDHYAAAVSARFQIAVETQTPFVERLVHFWSNHFAVSADKLGVVGLAGSLEFDAVRPHVLGHFSDMLLAVEQHPAMLLYLDQAQSTGPNSPFGQRIAARRGKQIGLNENLAREIMELHTLGVRSGYGQGDVTEFARALTGWSIAGIARGPVARAIGQEGQAGDFAFAAAVHEPGARTVMGKTYTQQGMAQARAILIDLANHPSTARHIAAKLARHFVSDDPPPALVKNLEATFLATGGNLGAVARALVAAPEAWQSASVKFKTPWEWMVSSCRAVGLSNLPVGMVANVMTQLGQPIWRPKSPAGYDDIAASWAGPDALFRRVEAAERLALRAGNDLDPRALASAILPGGISEQTQQVIARAESPVQGVSLLLVSPEFLRR
jgi:uncharacterized protein (DUF1800 family)